MIEPDKRKALYILFQEGMGKREIARRMGVSVSAVCRIIKQKGGMPDKIRKDKITIDPDLLRRLYHECQGWIQRMHEILTEDYNINVGYSTLTRLLRELDLNGRKKERCDQVPDTPGEEMQHDTTLYSLSLGNRRTKLICSVLYFRYSKIRYMKFYPSFNRFTMKCFLHEALSFWGYAASICIIDNTNLARRSGRGKSAVMAPEMEQFAKQYGFEFICHEIDHANRKAGNERSFYTVESNFLPGREFKNFADLNRQAFTWATKRMPNRPVSKTGIIPINAFDYEKSYLRTVHPSVTPPYRIHERHIDQYGYISFDGNYYWVPGKSRFTVKVLEYSNRIAIYNNRQLIIEYSLPEKEIKNKKFSPKGEPRPRFQPNNRKKPTACEEKQLRALDDGVDAYLNSLSALHGKKRHGVIRKLFALQNKVSRPLFIKTIRRALKYRVDDIDTVERIAGLLMQCDRKLEVPSATIDEAYRSRDAFLQGQFTDDVDMSVFDKLEETNG